MTIERARPSRVGIGLLIAAAVWAIGWGIAGGLSAGSVMNSSTPVELEDSLWNVEGPLMLVYGLSPALAALVAGVGALLCARAPKATVWKAGLGLFAGLVAATIAMQGSYLPRLFGIGGAMILLAFFGIVWLWAKERLVRRGASNLPADLRLVGYVFLLMATWFTCGIGSQPFLEALEGRDPTNPIHIMTLLVLGWVFLFSSHYVSGKQQEGKEEKQTPLRDRSTLPVGR